MQIFAIYRNVGFQQLGGAVEYYADGRISGPALRVLAISITAMLSNGEYVINAASTRKVSWFAPRSINSGHMPAHFATGWSWW